MRGLLYARGMETITVHGYMCEASWDGRELRARGTNKAAHRGLIGYTDVDEERINKPLVHKPDSFDDLKTATKDSLREAGEVLRDLARIPDELVLPAGTFRVIQVKQPSRLLNGRIVIQTDAGRKYQLHFRRKQADDLNRLAAALVQH